MQPEPIAGSLAGQNMPSLDVSENTATDLALFWPISRVPTLRARSRCGGDLRVGCVGCAARKGETRADRKVDIRNDESYAAAAAAAAAMGRGCGRHVRALVARV